MVISSDLIKNHVPRIKMSKIFEDNSQTIGHTPLIRLKHFGNGNILAKVESRNPSFSVKCRIGANMIWDAEKRHPNRRC